MPPTRMALAVQAGSVQAPSAAASAPAQAAALLQGMQLRDPQPSEAQPSSGGGSCNGTASLMGHSGSGSDHGGTSVGASNKARMFSGRGAEGHDEGAAVMSQSECQQGAPQDGQRSTAGTPGAASAHEAAVAPQQCSSLGDEDDTQLEQMEARYVHSVYDIIATHFSATRFAIWPKVLL